MSRPDAPIAEVRATAYRVPTEQPESDGTFEWEAVTVVVAEVDAGGHTGLGYTYTDASAAGLVAGALAQAVRGRDVHDPAPSGAAHHGKGDRGGVKR